MWHILLVVGGIVLWLDLTGLALIVAATVALKRHYRRRRPDLRLVDKEES